MSEAFATAARALLAALPETERPGLSLREVPAPTRLAPLGLAVAATVTRDDALARGDDGGADEVGQARLVVLHDPHGQEGWGGTTRVVAFVSSEVEPEMAADPALGEVGWSWLTEALAGAGARYTAAGGTVTRTVSTRFGQLQEAADASEVEIRASWTALDDDAVPGGLDLVAHLRAWCELVAATAGLPPVGISVLRR